MTGPDRTRIAFKRHKDLPPSRWRLAVYDLAGGAESRLTETRSIDDISGRRPPNPEAPDPRTKA